MAQFCVIFSCFLVRHMLLSHFRQLGNQKETLMVEIPTVASPSRLFGVLYQQHLSKIF